VGRIYQQTFLDTYAKVAFAKLYDRKNARVAADLLNDRVLPFFEEYKIPLLRVLTDRGTEYCGQREHHEYELYLAVEDIDHSRTKARHPQTNGIWMNGSPSTIGHARIRVSTATAKPRCRPSWIRFLWRGRRCSTQLFLPRLIRSGALPSGAQAEARSRIWPLDQPACQIKSELLHIR
jgi:hypothetical protein